MIVVTALLALACDTGPDGPGFVPTFITPPTKTETFAGTVAVGGSSSHPFVTSNYGEINITLTTAGSPDDIVMGVGLGAPTSVADPTCRLYQNGFRLTAAGSTPQVVGSVPAGAYCVQVFDAGNQPGSVTYSVTVVHPQ